MAGTPRCPCTRKWIKKQLYAIKSKAQNSQNSIFTHLKKMWIYRTSKDNKNLSDLEKKLHTLNRLLRENWALLKLKISVLQKKKSEKYLQNSLPDKRHACKLYKEFLNSIRTQWWVGETTQQLKGCSSRRLGLNHPQGGLQPSQTLVPRYLMPSWLWRHKALPWYTRTYARTQAKRSKLSDLSMLEQKES